MMVDSHCHLDRLDLASLGGDLDMVMAEARRQGVGRMLCVSINLELLPAMLEVVRRYPEVYASVGVHPNETAGREPAVEELLALAADPAVIAIGETGLDYYRSSGDLDWQQQRFRNHITAAQRSGLPVIIHSRDAWQDTLNILDEQPVPGVMHCFTGNRAQAEQALDRGLYVSFSGIVTFRNAADIREAASYVPLDRLLIETDAPYLTPVPFRGKSNQPAYVRYVADCIAGLRGIAVEDLIMASSENFSRLFRKTQH
ncbi:MAG: TatD family hydrolase [Gammaproteobacteria bacterium]|nr:TatD family hydrolase [Gammaproteobacteria bacterium]